MKKSFVVAMLAFLAVPAALVATDASAAPPGNNPVEVEKAARNALNSARQIHADALQLYKNSTATHAAASQEWSLAHWMAWRADRVAFDQLRILNDDKKLGAHGKCMVAHSDYSTAVQFEQRAINLNTTAAEMDKQAADLTSAANDVRGTTPIIAADLDKRAAEKKLLAATDRANALEANGKSQAALKSAQARAAEANAVDPGSCVL